MTKFCNKCRTTKAVTEFGSNKGRPDGLNDYCVECWRSISREQYLKNREKIAARYREKRSRGEISPRGHGVSVVCDNCGLGFKRGPGKAFTQCLPCRRGDEIQHGTCTTYVRGCRCRPCTTAASANAVHNRRRRLAEAGLPDDNCHRTRARRGGGKYEPVKPKAVFERDGWICGICSKPVDKNVKFPDRRSASLDHIVPLVKGGDHSYENVQCAHLNCNQSKAARYEPSVL